MFSYEDDPSKFAHAVHHTTISYAQDFDSANHHASATRYEMFATKAADASNSSVPDRAAAKTTVIEKVIPVPYQRLLERELHVVMPVASEVLNKQITVTCAHTNCQNSIRTCHFHTCPHCGSDKRYAETMCNACSRDPHRSTAKLPAPAPQPAQVYLPNIPESSILRVHCIGGGTHSSVHECLYDGLSACEKVLLKDDPSILLDEARIMAQIDRHPNILRIYGICQRSNGETSIIMELMQYDLLDILKSFQKHLSKIELSKIVPALVEYIAQAANGIRHMHRHGVIHRDVAARNMLFGNDVIKVADFGLAKCTSNRMTNGLPKPLSTAPECIKDLDNPSVWIDKSDVWSFGLMICEVFDLGLDPLDQFHHSVPALLDGLDRGWLPKRPTLCPDALWDLTLRCLRLNPHERPSMDDVSAVIATYQGAQRHEQKIQQRQQALLETKPDYFELNTPAAVPMTTLSYGNVVDANFALDTKAWAMALAGAQVSLPQDGYAQAFQHATAIPGLMTLTPTAAPDAPRKAVAEVDTSRSVKSTSDIPTTAPGPPPRPARRTSDVIGGSAKEAPAFSSYAAPLTAVPQALAPGPISSIPARMDSRSLDSAEMANRLAAVTGNGGHARLDSRSRFLSGMPGRSPSAPSPHSAPQTPSDSSSRPPMPFTRPPGVPNRSAPANPSQPNSNHHLDSGRRAQPTSAPKASKGPADGSYSAAPTNFY